MTVRYRAVPLDIKERRWRVFDYAARGGRGKFTGRYYRWPFARFRAERRAWKLNGG
jgi:hypothetical protein